VSIDSVIVNDKAHQQQDPLGPIKPIRAIAVVDDKAPIHTTPNGECETRIPSRAKPKPNGSRPACATFLGKPPVHST